MMSNGNNIDAVPLTVAAQTRLSLIAPGVKAARPDIIVQDESLPIDTINELFVQDLGGHELLNISRHDLIDGSQAEYSLISNTNKVNQKFNPQNIVSIPGKLSEVFRNFTIELQNHAPDFGTDDNVTAPGDVRDRVYISKITGNLVIDVINLNINDRVEVEILNSGEIINDTMDVEES
jgi:hypothetical protein